MLSGGAGQYPIGFGDRFSVPQVPVLVLQQDELPSAVEAGGGAGPVQPDQREQSRDLGFGRHQLVQQGRQPLGVVDEVARLGPLGGAQVPLVGQQVDHRQDLGQAGAELSSAGIRYGMPASLILRLAG